MNNPLPLYEVQELSLEELVHLMSESNRPAANDVILSDLLNIEELSRVLQA